MDQNILFLAEAYYRTMEKKDIVGLEKYLHADVQFRTPLVQTTGKKAFLEAAQGFISQFKSLTIKTKLSSPDLNQAMVVYDIEFPHPIGRVPTAGLLTFDQELIAKIELFYDARSLVQKSE